MQDFNDYKNSATGSANVFDIVKKIASDYDGKSQAELISAIIKEAEKGKRAGTLKNSDLDNFKNTLSPFLDAKQRGYLVKVIERLKKI